MAFARANAAATLSFAPPPLALSEPLLAVVVVLLLVAAKRASFALRCFSSRSRFSLAKRSLRASNRCLAFSALLRSSLCSLISDFAWR